MTYKVRIQLPNGKWFDYFKGMTEQEAEDLKDEVKGEFLNVMKAEVVPE